MRGKSLSCWLLAMILFASISVGCRAPYPAYPTYNPNGFYGNPCVNPPGTGVYNPTGQPNPYYQGAPNTGVYPPNPYGATGGYPPQQQPVQWQGQPQGQPRASNGAIPSGVVQAGSLNPAAGPSGAVESSSRVAGTNGQWSSVNENRPDFASTTPTLDVNATYGNTPASSARVASIRQFDGFATN